MVTQYFHMKQAIKSRDFLPTQQTNTYLKLDIETLS